MFRSSFRSSSGSSYVPC